MAIAPLMYGHVLRLLTLYALPPGGRTYLLQQLSEIAEERDFKLNQVAFLVEPVYGPAVPGSQILCKAAEGGHVQVVRALLEGGASAAKVDSQGKTRLILALENKHSAAAEELLEGTKQVGMLDAQAARLGGRGMSALMHASAAGLTDLVQKLLGLDAKPALT